MSSPITATPDGSSSGSPGRLVSPWLASKVDRLPKPNIKALPDDDPNIRPLIGRVVGQALAHVCEDTVAAAEAFAASFATIVICEHKPTPFDNPNLSTLGSIESFVERLATQVPLCSDALALTLVYIDRIISGCLLPVSLTNIHRLFAVCFVCASKFAYDRVYSNKFYAKVSGLAVDELNRLELELFQLFRWNLSVTFEEWHFYASAIATIALPQKLNRAFLRPPSPSAIVRRLSAEVDAAHNRTHQQV